MLTEDEVHALVEREFRCVCRDPETLDPRCTHHAVTWLVRMIYGLPHPPQPRAKPHSFT